MVGEEDTPLKPSTVSAPCADETESNKNIGGLFSLSLGMEDGSLLSSGCYTTSMNYLGESISSINNFFPWGD